MTGTIQCGDAEVAVLVGIWLAVLALYVVEIILEARRPR